MKTIRNIIIAIAILTMCGWCSHYEHHYTRVGTVTRVDCIEIIVRDNSGHYWSFKGYDYSVGDTVKLKMYDNYTSSDIYDDKIIEVEKCI